MDGQCQDEFRHCTDPGSDHERINITFRWVKQHVASCSFLRTGVACCLPTCARVFFSFWYGVGGERCFFLASPWCLVHLGGASFAGHSPCVYKAWVSKICLLLYTPCGRSMVGGIIFATPGRGLLGSTKKLPVGSVACLVILWFQAVYASFRGMAQSPWLLCMYGKLGYRGIP